MEEILETGAIQGTTPDEEPHAEQEAPEPAEGASQPDEGEQGVESSEQETRENADEQPFLHVRYNHEDVGLSAEQAAEFAQIGMKFHKNGLKYDQVKPILDKLDYLAAQRNMSVEEAVDSVLQGDEEAHRKELEDKFGNDDSVIEELMKVYRDKQKDKYNKLIADRLKDQELDKEKDRKSLESRLADEFLELKKEFPEIKDFAAVPAAVKQQAAKGRDLLSCYLRWRHAMDVKAAEAKKSAEEAAKASTGQLAGNAEDGQSEAEKQFLKGLWGK